MACFLNVFKLQITKHFSHICIFQGTYLVVHQWFFVKKDQISCISRPKLYLKAELEIPLIWFFWWKLAVWRVSGGSLAAPSFMNHVHWENIAGYKNVYKVNKIFVKVLKFIGSCLLSMESSMTLSSMVLWFWTVLNGKVSGSVGATNWRPEFLKRKLKSVIFCSVKHIMGSLKSFLM